MRIAFPMMCDARTTPSPSQTGQMTIGLGVLSCASQLSAQTHKAGPRAEVGRTRGRRDERGSLRTRPNAERVQKIPTRACPPRRRAAAPPGPTTPDEPVDLLCAWFARATGPDRTATTARLAFFLEASHDAGLRDHATRGRAALAAWAVPVLGRLGARDPQAAFVAVAAAAEGLLLHAIARHDPADPRPTLTSAVRGALWPAEPGLPRP